jgi:ABC-type transport system involved in multi-copper enzyme maturation permease subunit
MPIFDQGYQNWRGPLSGHAWRWLAIARHGVRVQMTNRLLRLLLLASWLPALVLVAAVALWGLVEQKSQSVLGIAQALLPADVLLDPRAYRSVMWTLSYSVFFTTQMYVILFLVLIAGPGLISRDLRFNALPLYFARPLTRLDYFLGKLGVIGALVAAVAVVPAVFAYVIGVCFCLDLTVVRDTYPVLLASVAYGLVVTLSVGTLMLALSSLTRRSLYVAIAWAGLWIISGTVGTVLTELHRETVRREIVETELARWVEDNPPPPGVQMWGNRPALQYRMDLRRMQLAGIRPEQEKAAEEWYQRWNQAWGEGWAKALDRQGEGARSDWRPLFSYSANLKRIADHLLDTHSAWLTIGKAFERSRQAVMGPLGAGRGRPRINEERRLADQMVAQYPWEWSAGVLAGLLGLSTWTLTRRVKSLDRLK